MKRLLLTLCLFIFLLQFSVPTFADDYEYSPRLNSVFNQIVRDQLQAYGYTDYLIIGYSDPLTMQGYYIVYYISDPVTSIPDYDFNGTYVFSNTLGRFALPDQWVNSSYFTYPHVYRADTYQQIPYSRDFDYMPGDNNYYFLASSFDVTKWYWNSSEDYGSNLLFVTNRIPLLDDEETYQWQKLTFTSLKNIQYILLSFVGWFVIKSLYKLFNIFF